MRILVVQIHPDVNQAVARHYPLWLNAGFDRIIGTTSRFEGTVWPGDAADLIEVGEYGYIAGARLPKKFLGALACGLLHGADEIVVIEWDCLLFGTFPSPLLPGFTSNVTGGPQAGYKCTRYFHCPWAFTAEAAKAAVIEGQKMIDEGDIEGGTTDCFIGRLVDRLALPVNTGFFRSYSQNAFDLPGSLEAAREAYLAGAHAIHGCKSQRELNFIFAP